MLLHEITHELPIDVTMLQRLLDKGVKVWYYVVNQTTIGGRPSWHMDQPLSGASFVTGFMEAKTADSFHKLELETVDGEDFAIPLQRSLHDRLTLHKTGQADWYVLNNMYVNRPEYRKWAEKHTLEFAS